jgi:Protein of unknown function (DUF3047)
MLRVLAGIAAIALAGLVALGATGSMTLLVEDWGQPPVGTAGVPKGWLELPLLQRALVKLGALDIVEDDGRRALRLKTSASEHTIIRKQIRVDLRATPVLEWHWKVVVLPTGADLRQRSRSDSPAVLAVAWHKPEKLIGYAWDVTAPVGSRFNNPKQARVLYIVVRSGDADRGRWLTERRDVGADYQKVFGAWPPTGPEEIEVSVDSNDTRSVAETLVGSIRFVQR